MGMECSRLRCDTFTSTPSLHSPRFTGEFDQGNPSPNSAHDWTSHQLNYLLFAVCSQRVSISGSFEAEEYGLPVHSLQEWVQCNDRRQHQKHQKTDKKSEECLGKAKQSRKAWMLSRIGSNIKQKALKANGEEFQELRRNNSCEEEDRSMLESISQLPIPILPESGLQIPVDHLPIPCGTFTEILSAEFSHSPVTIKREKPSCCSSSSILRKELHVLSKVHHPNILLLMGLVKMDSSAIVTIFEDASNGTLHHLLHRQKTVLPSVEIQKFLTQLCHVMMFLHERGWIHAGITSHTIVITVNSTIKLTGFETARQLNMMEDENSITKYLRKQWFQWQSPEQLDGQSIISTETDIFSVGLISWEMCTNIEPWYGYTYDELLMKYKSLNCALESKGLPSPFAHSRPESFLHGMQQMLQIDPKKRISCFLDVLSQIHKLQTQPPSTMDSASHHIQPNFVRSLEKAQMLFQPQPQKATLASSKPYHTQDRDPYTGLKRVSNSWQKLNGKSSLTTSLDMVNICLPRTNNRGKEMCSSQNLSTHTNRPQARNKLSSESCNACFNKLQSHCIQQSPKDSRTVYKETQGNNTIPFETQINMQKYNLRPAHKLLFISDSENYFSQSVPIKPASHMNQRTTSFKNNYTKAISEKTNIQYRGIRCPRLSNGNISSNKTKWEIMESSNLPHNREFGQSKTELSDKTISKKPVEKDISSHIKYPSTENESQYCNHQSDRKYRNDVEVHHSHYSNKYQYSDEIEGQLHKTTLHDTCLSDTDSKDNGFESTDSGIFTISREFDQNILNQTNSTEDLYIDDEFCMEMELDSHMQLLCLFDNSSEYNEQFLNSTLTDDENICE